MGNVYEQADAARRYDTARDLPDQTKLLWLNFLKAVLPVPPARGILDLGCGTGRFTVELGQVFACPVVGMDPSEAMLNVARARNLPNVRWEQASAEAIPLESASVDFVFMSQVFHHLTDRSQAFGEIHRVLTAPGSLAVRNGTRENNAATEWLSCFPEALRIDEERIPSRQEVERLICRHGFTLLSRQTLSQLFAGSYEEYYEKIGQRGLSSLIAISDAAFQDGMRRFRGWVDDQPRDRAVYEPVDVFVFRKS